MTDVVPASGQQVQDTDFDRVVQAGGLYGKRAGTVYYEARDESGSADSKHWRMEFANGTMKIVTANDANDTAATAYTITRSGNSVTKHEITVGGSVVSTFTSGGYNGVIGGTTPAAGTFTTLVANTSLKVGSEAFASTLKTKLDISLDSGGLSAIGALTSAHAALRAGGDASEVGVIAAGYIDNSATYAPVAFGAATVSNSGFTSAAFVIATRTATTDTQPDVRVRVTGNILLGGTAEPASAVGSLVQFTGTAPTGSVTDGYAQYSADQTAGNAAPHFRTEGGDVVLLFTGAALTAADGGTVNSGDATTDGVINNIRTRLGELEARMQANGLIT